MLNGQLEEHRRIYERTLRLVLILAMHELYPKVRVRFENSLNGGIFITVQGMLLDRHVIATLSAKMQDIIDAKMEIRKVRMSKKDAVDYFGSIGRYDTVRMLNYRMYEYCDVYEVGSLKEYCYGDVAGNTSEVPYFGIWLHLPGMVLTMPFDDFSKGPDPFVNKPKLESVYAHASRISRMLGWENAADINELVLSGKTRELIRISEAIQADEIMQIARWILERGARSVFISGPSSSGKTTFAHRLSIDLKALGRTTLPISLDDYYRPDEEIPIGPDGQMDLECPGALDIPLFNDHLIALLNGKKVQIPTYSFHSRNRTQEKEPIQMDERSILLIEGIHGLNPGVGEGVPADSSFKIFVYPAVQLNLDDHNRIRTTDLRLLRRAVRDIRMRNTPVIQTLQMWDNVRNGERIYVRPYQESADLIFNSFQPYEFSVFKKYAMDMFKSVPRDDPHYAMARRQVKFLNYFAACRDEDEIPPTSIVREFIGGNTFYE